MPTPLTLSMSRQAWRNIGNTVLLKNWGWSGSRPFILAPLPAHWSGKAYGRSEGTSTGRLRNRTVSSLQQDGHTCARKMPCVSLRRQFLSRLGKGGKLAPKKWEGEIKKLEADCRELAKKSGEQTFQLAFVEVIWHNRKMFEAEQRQADRSTDRRKQAEQEQQKPKRRKDGMEL